MQADRHQHVGDDFRRDRHARRARPAILARVTEIRNRCGDARGRRAFQRIDHHQHFHQVVVRRRARRLQNEDVASTHVLEELDHHFAVREPADDAASKADVQMPADRLRELRVRVAGEDPHPIECHGRCAALWTRIAASKNRGRV